MCDHPIETPCECEKEFYALNMPNGYYERLAGCMYQRTKALRTSHATLHSELVQLRLAYAEIEEERNRLAGENRQMDRELSRLARMTGVRP